MFRMATGVVMKAPEIGGDGSVAATPQDPGSISVTNWTLGFARSDLTSVPPNLNKTKGMAGMECFASHAGCP